MGPATTGPRDVTRYLTAAMALMRQTAHSAAMRACFHAIMGCVSLNATSVTTTMTVETEAMSLTAHILHVEATTSRVPVAAASIKSGFVMERMTVKIMQMKKAVIMYNGSVTQENGHVHLLACASPWISFVMGRLTVQMERMKLTPLLDATAVFGDVPP